MPTSVCRVAVFWWCRWTARTVSRSTVGAGRRPSSSEHTSTCRLFTCGASSAVDHFEPAKSSARRTTAGITHPPPGLRAVLVLAAVDSGRRAFGCLRYRSRAVVPEPAEQFAVAAAEPRCTGSRQAARTALVSWPPSQSVRSLGEDDRRPVPAGGTHRGGTSAQPAADDDHVGRQLGARLGAAGGSQGEGALVRANCRRSMVDPRRGVGDGYGTGSPHPRLAATRRGSAAGRAPPTGRG